MEHLTALNAKKVKELKTLLLDQFGCTLDLPFAYFLSNKNRIYAITRDITRIDAKALHPDSLGLYIGAWEETLRLSLEGSQLVGPHAKHHILELQDAELTEYVKGNPFDLSPEHGDLDNGVYLVKHGNDFFGCCKISSGKLYNFLPKARRVKVINS